MGVNPRVFRNMTTAQRRRYVAGVLSLHRALALINAIGLMVIGVDLIIVTCWTVKLTH